MLANKWLPKHTSSESYVYIQPKLDGVRLLIGKQHGKTEAFSRSGKPVNNVDHIIKIIDPILREGEFWDGECYKHVTPLQEISGSFRRGGAGQDLEFWVFDRFNLNTMGVSFEKRIGSFEKRLRGPVKFVDTIKVKNDEIKQYHDKFVLDGYEGIMIRKANSLYHMGKRSNGLYKHKDFDDHEFEIVGYTSARGRDTGTVVWECKCGDATFHTRPRGTFEQKQQWFREGKTMIGKMLTVRHQGYTDDGLPRFPVGIQIRDYE